MNERAQKKTESRRRILSAASRLFKIQGYSATGVDAVMAAADLTAGGFYAHFSSKSELLQESLRQSLLDAWQWMHQGVSPKTLASTLPQRYLKKYLSTQHRDHPEWGCPLVGIAAELARPTGQSAQPISEYLEKWTDELIKIGFTRPEALRWLSMAVGALHLSRLTQPEPLSDEILKAAQKMTPPN